MGSSVTEIFDGRGGDFTKTLSVTSGKGGVGKTNIVCNLAYEIARQGKRVLILDGDLGMANVDVMFGVRAKYHIGDVLNGRCSMAQTLIQATDEITIIPGGSGIYGLNGLKPFQQKSLLDQISDLNDKFDYLLIDTAPGIDDNVLALNAAAQEILLILTLDPSSLTDAYALTKLLAQKSRVKQFSVICNQVLDESEGLKLYKRFTDVTTRFLSVKVTYKGFIPYDNELKKATKRQKLVLEYNGSCPASFAFRRLGKNLSDHSNISLNKGGLQFFWDQLVGVA